MGICSISSLYKTTHIRTGRPSIFFCFARFRSGGANKSNNNNNNNNTNNNNSNDNRNSCRTATGPSKSQPKECKQNIVYIWVPHPIIAVPRQYTCSNAMPEIEVLHMTVIGWWQYPKLRRTAASNVHCLGGTSAIKMGYSEDPLLHIIGDELAAKLLETKEIHPCSERQAYEEEN